MATINENTESGGFVLVTIAGSPADISPSSQKCRYCYVAQLSGTQVYMNINAAATTGKWKLQAATATPLKLNIRNLSMLHFIGTASDKVQILWFS